MKWIRWVCLGTLSLIALATLFAPCLTRFDPTFQIFEGLNDWGMPLAPSLAHPLGTDEMGRDALSRLLYGGRMSLFVGISATLLTGSIGLGIGVLSGFFGGWVDACFMRLTEVFMAFPVLLLAIGLAAVLPPSPWMLVLTLGLVGWTSLARVVRALVLGLRQREYVQAAEALGGGFFWIVVRHLVPNLLSTVGALLTVKLADMFLLEASLSFLGLGIRPPHPSWGGMIHEGQALFRTAPWLMMAPGLLILLSVLACNLLGESLDPRQG